MSHYSGSVPDPERAPDWRTSAACRKKRKKSIDPELFFTPADEETAKAICGGCPVRRDCLAFALDNSISHGIFGGLDDRERDNLRRNERRRNAKPIDTPEPKRPAPPPPKTLAEAVSRHAQPTDDGHALWYGIPHMVFEGRRYTALQAVFIVGYGREPEGNVRRACGNAECCYYGHLTDAVIRNSDAICGTRPGYQRHRKLGEDACARCRAANADADNLLRRTGSTKASA